MKGIRLISSITLIMALLMGAISCKQANDADIQRTAQELLISDAGLEGVVVTVEKQVATLTGIVEEDAQKAKAEKVVADVENVKSVVNKIDVIPPAPDYTAMDETINTALTDLLKDLDHVTATVEEGVITLEGEIKESDLPALMEKLNTLNPEQIVNNLDVK